MKLPQIILSAIGALLPDLDTKSSLIRKMLPFISIKHRGTTHSIFFGMIILLVSSLFFKEAPILAIGYFSHLFLDSLTPQGVAWLYPISKKKLRGPIKSGGIFERVLVFFLVIAIIILI